MILRNSIRTPDGTELVSRHRHDFQTHAEGDRVYFVDGGIDYLRRSGHRSEVDTSIIVGDEDYGNPLVREHLAWGTYGKSGTEPLHYIVLKDMETEHIQNILHENNNLHYFYRRAFRLELERRNEKRAEDQEGSDGSDGADVRGSLSTGQIP